MKDSPTQDHLGLPASPGEGRKVFSKRNSFAPPRFSASGGYSMPEVLVAIAVLGAIAALAAASISGTFQAAREETAGGNLSHLNRAVMGYSHAVSELTNAATTGIADEQAVFTALQVRSASIPGTPFLNQTFTLVSSSDSATYRASWNGYTFELLKPGTAGTGVDLTKLQ